MGLRGEYINIKLSANESVMSYDYINLFPSLSSSYEKNGHNFSLRYSRRISRLISGGLAILPIK